MSHATISFIILGAAVVLFVMNRFPPELVAIGAALALYAAGVLSAGQVVAGFGDPAVVFIASLLIVSEGLYASGVIAWAGQQLIARAGADYRRLLVWLLVCVAVASALITPNGAVPALIPVAVVMAMRVKRSPSMFLMPLAFSGITGSLLALSGSPVNVSPPRLQPRTRITASVTSASLSSESRWWRPSSRSPCGSDPG